MTVRKVDSLLRGDRTPAYVNRETGAADGPQSHMKKLATRQRLP
jgi:hypothetical protein